ncbi:hypothetical protein JWG45_12550 [Leptospira sp. 201903070]|uniref:Outer membrane protein beta-barrel domain-containing protein n=1 Tax=Leptospira ainlahdjerensis TaxID=2810033 RepID=A0ABS2UDF0_9LEPT|nr:hypothetical protein [Leptospira ainlahdjerensis]MBM9577978.1 hypothetical protein [Leptospira ainlahdjerensis]
MRKEYSIFLIGLTFALYPGISVFAEGEPEKEVNAQYTPWSLKIGGGIGKGEDAHYKEDRGRTNGYRFSAEYNPRYFGFELGITHKVFSLDVSSQTDYILLPYLAYVNIGRNGNVSNERIYNTLMTAGDLQREKDNFSLTFLDFGPTFHMRPGKTFDPYISIGAGITGFDKFASYRGFGRLGFKINFDRFFIFTEAEGSSINRHFARDLRFQYNEYSGMVGLGFHFGGGGEESSPPEKKEEPVENVSSSER